MSWTIGTVTLPLSPERIIHPCTAIIEKFPFTGGTSLVTSIGIDAEEMTVNVTLKKNGYSLEQLSGSYYNPLAAYLGSAVVVNFPLTMHNGTWLMSSCSADQNNVAPDRIVCVIKFMKGSGITIL